jgi:hypothetical protein
MSTKFQKSKDLFRILLQIARSKTNELPSILCALLVATHSSLVTSSLFLLVWVVLASSLLVVYQTSVGCSCVILFRVLSGVPSLLVLISSHSVEFCPPSPKPQTLEYSWLSLLAPVRFMCSPCLLKSQFSIQLFGSTNVIPSVFAIQSYLPFNAPIRRHDTSLRHWWINAYLLPQYENNQPPPPPKKLNSAIGPPFRCVKYKTLWGDVTQVCE